MDKLKQIEAFVDAVEKGSLARAAIGQNITPVMLGRRIDDQGNAGQQRQDRQGQGSKRKTPLDSFHDDSRINRLSTAYAQ